MGDSLAFTSSGPLADGLGEAIQRIRRFSDMQIQGMAQIATSPACHACLHAVAACVDSRINELERMVRRGRTQPLRRLRLAEDEPPDGEAAGRLRVGIYPIAANPLHWGHLAVGLKTLVCLELDKVVFVIAGSDPRKPDLVSPEIRHRLGREVIRIFEPFLAYSPIALGTDLDGETNLGRLLALNAHRAIHAFYIAGSDHCRRRNRRGEPDTIEKLERVAREAAQADNSRPVVSAVFVERPGDPLPPEGVDTFLDVRILPPLPLACSSTAARRALCREGFSKALTYLPYDTLASIWSLNLYEGKACPDEISGRP